MDLRRLKADMVTHAKKCGERIPRINTKSAVWGGGARVLAWRITGKHGKASTKAARVCAVLHPRPQKPKIINDNLKFRYLYRRVGDPPFIVLHNSGASTGTVEGIHNYHLSLGWAGCAYHFVVYKNGEIHKGRPLWAMGGHTHTWGNTVGVCFIGNYESSDRVMPKKQLDAGKKLLRWLRVEYPKAQMRGHRQMPNNATACPGKYFPTKEITD